VRARVFAEAICNKLHPSSSLSFFFLIIGNQKEKEELIIPFYFDQTN